MPAPGPLTAPQPAAAEPVAVPADTAATTPTPTPTAAPAPLALPVGDTTVAVPKRRSWLVVDIVAEARAIGRMFVDPRYRLSWWARVMVLVLIAAFVTSALWVPGVALGGGLGYVINKIADLLIGFVLFKVLGHEAQRYRETAPDLPPTLRL